MGKGRGGHQGASRTNGSSVVARVAVAKAAVGRAVLARTVPQSRALVLLGQVQEVFKRLK